MGNLERLSKEEAEYLLTFLDLVKDDFRQFSSVLYVVMTLLQSSQKVSSLSPRFGSSFPDLGGGSSETWISPR
jgi:hypothetical protein